MSNGKELTGMRFGRLTVISRDYSKHNKHDRYWLCRCDCGKEKSVTTGHLTSGTVKSCGCIRKEQSIERFKEAAINNIRHGEAGTRLYEIWNMMRQRCNNPKNSAYKWYGGKGVKVCNEWNDFAIFTKWSRDNGYEDKKGVARAERMSIDRIDSNGDYCPENCRWITISENSSRASRGKHEIHTN